MGGVVKKHWRDLGSHDAFADSDVGHCAGDGPLFERRRVADIITGSS